MAVKRRVVKSCCGRSNHLFEAPKPIRKFQLAIFKDAGYESPENFIKAGIFYVKKANLIATAPFGTSVINVKCHGDDCSKKFDEFSEVLEKAVQTDKI